MKKIVKLSEKDLTRIVKRVIKEQGYSKDEMWDTFSDDGDIVKFQDEIKKITNSANRNIDERNEILLEISYLITDIEDSDTSNEVKNHLIMKLSNLERELYNF
jgi:hypothetical protein